MRELRTWSANPSRGSFAVPVYIETPSSQKDSSVRRCLGQCTPTKNGLLGGKNVLLHGYALIPVPRITKSSQARRLAYATPSRNTTQSSSKAARRRSIVPGQQELKRQRPQQDHDIAPEHAGG